jgi:phosphomevalonate kinase
VRVLAPGKLLLTGGYAVLEGARAIVCAIDRYAVASGDPAGAAQRAVSPEIMAAMEGVGAETPHVDTSSLFSNGQKLGLGSSAAAVVAALGRVAALRGEHLGDAPVRQEIFDRARAAHARVQSGGSGVDVAASVYGGVLCYSLRARGRPSISPVDLPEGLHIDAYWSGHSVRTSEMRARVDRLKLRDKDLFAARMGELSAAAEAAASAIGQGDAPRLIEAAQASERGLFALGRDADTPIVPPSAHGLVRLAEEERSAFLPSGAGGGDVFVRLAQGAPSPRFAKEAEALGLEKLDFAVDILGVHTTGKLRGEPSP